MIKQHEQLQIHTQRQWKLDLTASLLLTGTVFKQKRNKKTKNLFNFTSKIDFYLFVFRKLGMRYINLLAYNFLLRGACGIESTEKS